MDLDHATRTRLQSAALVPSKVFNRATKARVLLRRQFVEALEDVDVLVSTTAPFPAPEAHDPHRFVREPRRRPGPVLLQAFLPRLLRAHGDARHLHSGGLHVPGEEWPIGLQLGAAPFAEETVLRAAQAYESATDWHLKRAPHAQ